MEAKVGFQGEGLQGISILVRISRAASLTEAGQAAFYDANLKFPNTLDRHLFQEWIKSFGLTTGAVLGLFYVQNLYDNLGDFLDKGTPWLEILLYYLLITPSLLVPVLPLAVLISTLLSYGALHRNQEINAMRAVGCGLFRLMRANLLFAGILTLVMYALGSGGLSWSVEQSREKIEAVKERSQKSGEPVNEMEYGWVHKVAFENSRTRHLWVMNRYHKPTLTGYGVYLYFRDERGNEHERLASRYATYDPVSQKWYFRQGRRVFYDEDGHPLRFENFALRVLGSLDPPSTLVAPKRKLSELSLRELKDQAHASAMGGGKQALGYRIRYQEALASPLNCIFGLILGVPFAISGQRVNPMAGATRAIGIFVGYFLFSSLCRILGEHALLEPAAAAWIPPVVLCSFAIWKLSAAR